MVCYYKVYAKSGSKVESIQKDLIPPSKQHQQNSVALLLRHRQLHLILHLSIQTKLFVERNQATIIWLQVVYTTIYLHLPMPSLIVYVLDHQSGIRVHH